MNTEKDLQERTEQVLTIPVVSERFFSCDCEGEGLLLTKDEEDKSIYFALYGYGVGYNPKPSMIDRIKYAWYHIKTGKKYADSIIMDYEKAKEVSGWLDSNAR
jgi:hypothetical protein